MSGLGRPRSRIAVYYPSFAHWGGAERLALQTAAALAEEHDVVLCAEDVPSPEALSAYFGIDLSDVEVKPLRPGGPLTSRIVGPRTRVRRWRYAVLRWSHGRQLARTPADLLVSVAPSPPIACRHPLGVYSCFFPAGDETESFGRSAPARLYHGACRVFERALLGSRSKAVDSWDEVIACSHYTAMWIDRLWNRAAVVVPPPCDDMGPPGEKERWILSVGRFQPPTTTAPSKSFEALIDAFRELHAHSEYSIELHLAGHCADDDASRMYLQELRDAARDLPVVFHVSIDHDELRELYRRSALFWLATGFGFDPARLPGKQEHFGIVTVEAMSAGAIPLLYASGGSVEIIGDHGVGALWTSIEELVSASLAIFSDEQEARRQAAKCAELASAYAPEEFARRTRKAVNAVLRATAPLVVPRP